MTHTRKTTYTNAAQQRLVKVMLALFSDVVMGVSPTALAKTVGCSASNITRDLDNLATAGVAERDEETGHWRITPRVPQHALKALASLDRYDRRVSEVRQRFTRNPD